LYCGAHAGTHYRLRSPSQRETAATSLPAGAPLLPIWPVEEATPEAVD